MWLGQQLIIEAMECAVELTRRVLISTVEGLPPQLGLHVVAGPAFFDQVAPDKETRVIVCLVILAESHLALHAFPAERFVHVDLFSCKPFAIGAARAFIESQFRPSSLVLHTLDRAR